MLEKGFLRDKGAESSRHRKIASKTSQALLVLGVVILIGSFIYLLVNWGKSDALLTMMMPLLASGLGLIFVSYLIKKAFSKLNR